MSPGINKARLIKSLMAAVFLGDLIFSGNHFKNSLMEIILALLLYLLFDRTDRMRNNLILRRPYEMVFSITISLFTVLGKYLDSGRDLASLSYSQMLQFLLQVISACLVAVGIVRLLCCRLVTCRKEQKRILENPVSDLKAFLFAFIVIWLCWFLVWHAYYPGLWNYDPFQVKEVLEDKYDKLHPLLHTLLMGKLYQFGLSAGNAAIGVMLYDLIQSTILAATLSLAYMMVRRYSNTRVIPMITLVFYALNPVNAIMAISTTKDVLFSAFVLLSLLTGIALLMGTSIYQRLLTVILVISLTLTALFRNNGIYCLLLCAVVSVFMIRKLYWKKCLVVF